MVIDAIAAHSPRAAAGYDALLPAAERRRTGAWYTPPALVAHVVAHTVGRIARGAVVRVLDPSCGDGRFLYEAARVIRAAGGVPELTGVDIDLGGLASTPSTEPVEAIEADALSHQWGMRRFDVIVGNPPFLSQMASVTARTGRSAFGGGPYADAAADFLALAVRLARSDGGRIGLVLPVSLLTARDAGPIRAEVLRDAALQWFWSSREPVFDATVRTCAIGFVRGTCSSAIHRTTGISFDPASPLAGPVAVTSNDHWGFLIADLMGMPVIPNVRAAGVVGDRALVTANFRDQYYGLVGAVSDDAPGPPLITTGVIDVGTCHWGERPIRFAKQRYDKPRVDRSKLVPFMQRWADRCLVPKVLVATQTHVLEAVADQEGAWLPAVPVIRVVPHDQADLWSLAAVLTSPVASALIAEQSVGSGLSATTMRVSQRTLGSLAWPAGDLGPAVGALRDGDFAACGQLVDTAYGVADDDLFAWWHRGLMHRS